MSHTHHTTAAHIAPSHERRETPRVRALGRLHGFILSINAPVSVRELGMGGFSVQATRAFVVDDVHDVRLSLKGGQPVTLRGRVVYSRLETAAHAEGVYVTGFALLEDATGEVADALGSLLDAITGSLSFDQ